MKPYPPILVALHWGLALMILLALVMGTFVLATTPNTDPDKLNHLQTHMPLGILILVLMITRLIVRFVKPLPAPIESGNPVLDRLGPLVHTLLYLVVISMALSGLATSIMAGLPQIVFGGSGELLPINFDNLLPRRVHGFLAIILMILIALHLIGFAYRQFIRKENLIKRMWFARRD